MSDRIKNLINAMAQEEERALNQEFLAPCVRGGRIRARVANLIYTFKALPEDFEGWGIFLPLSTKEAELLEEASLFQVSEYLQLLASVRVRLAFHLRGQTWLAYPANASDFAQKFGAARPLLAHLVSEGAKFDQIIACAANGTFFFEAIDRRSDPQLAAQLREELQKETAPDGLAFANLTPEMRVCYSLSAHPQLPEKRRRRGRQSSERTKPLTDEERLQEALQMGGGGLRNFTDHGEFWTVEWTTPNGEHHTSAISKDDLTVISSGICLSGRDRDFDLQSLVGVFDWQ
ncbi:MAG: hypothetical protein AB1757_09280 [Acidobacteriota bacterium]